MSKKKGLPLLIWVIALVLVIAGAVFWIYTDIKNNLSNRNVNSSQEEGLNEGEEYIPAWVPFTVSNSPEHELEGYLFEPLKVEPASVREAAESGNNEDRIESKIKEKVPHYPFEQIPLIKADMLVYADEKIVGDDMSISVTYYTKATVDETLEFYRNALRGYDRFDESIIENTSGKSYDLPFSTQIEGKYRMDAGVMVMEMPESTGYTCCLYIHGVIRGIAKKEDEPVGYREDGLPENYPENIVPLLKLREINMAEGDSTGCYIQYFSDATYKEAIEFYRDKLSDKTDYTENDETPGEVWIRCKALEWDIDVRIMENDDNSYMEINCYLD